VDQILPYLGDMGHNKFNSDFRQPAKIKNNSDKKATTVEICAKIVDF